MTLERHDPVLRPRPAARVEVVVAREEPHAEVRVEVPRPPGHSDPDFWLEAPTICAEIDQLRAVVLAGRRRHGQARPDDGLSRCRRVCPRAHRRVTNEVDRKFGADVGETRARDGLSFLADATAHLTPGDRHDDARERQLAEQAERIPRGEGDTVDRGLNVGHRQCGIDEDRAGGTPNARDEERDADGTGRECLGLEFLGSCSGGEEQDGESDRAAPGRGPRNSLEKCVRHAS